MAVPAHGRRTTLVLLLVLWALAACTDRPTVPAMPAAIDGLTPVGQVEVGSTIRLVVKVTDVRGLPIAGVRVDWAVEPRGSVAPSTGITDPEGIAETTWILDTTPGEQNASARAEGLPPVHFRAVTHPAPPARVILPMDSVRLFAAGDTLRLTATARDRYGNEIGARAITWTSSDNTVVRVESPGLLRAVGRGTAHVVARAGEAADTTSVYVIPLGVFTITFDDGLISAYTRAFQILREVGLRGNIAVNPLAIDRGWSGYLSLPELRELHGAGWSIVSHSMSHPDLTRLSEQELARELSESAAWIRRSGFSGSTVFIVPYHSWNAREMAAVKRHYAAARGHSVNPPWEQRFQPWPASDPYLLSGVEPELLEGSFTSAAGRQRLRAVIEEVIDRGFFVDVYFHEIREEQHDGFRETARLLGDYRERFRAYHELFPG